MEESRRRAHTESIFQRSCRAAYSSSATRRTICSTTREYIQQERGSICSLDRVGLERGSSVAPNQGGTFSRSGSRTSLSGLSGAVPSRNRRLTRGLSNLTQNDIIPEVASIVENSSNELKENAISSAPGSPRKLNHKPKFEQSVLNSQILQRLHESKEIENRSEIKKGIISEKLSGKDKFSVNSGANRTRSGSNVEIIDSAGKEQVKNISKISSNSRCDLPEKDYNLEKKIFPELKESSDVNKDRKPSISSKIPDMTISQIQTPPPEKHTENNFNPISAAINNSIQNQNLLTTNNPSLIQNAFPNQTRINSQQQIQGNYLRSSTLIPQSSHTQRMKYALSSQSNSTTGTGTGSVSSANSSTTHSKDNLLNNTVSSLTMATVEEDDDQETPSQNEKNIEFPVYTYSVQQSRTQVLRPSQTGNVAGSVKSLICNSSKSKSIESTSGDSRSVSNSFSVSLGTSCASISNLGNVNPLQRGGLLNQNLIEKESEKNPYNLSVGEHFATNLGILSSNAVPRRSWRLKKVISILNLFSKRRI